MYVLINFGNIFKIDFKLVLFFFNMDDLRRNDRFILEFVIFKNVLLKISDL